MGGLCVAAGKDALASFRYLSGGWLRGWRSFCSKLQTTVVEGQTQKPQIWRPAGKSGCRHVPKSQAVFKPLLGRGVVLRAYKKLETALSRPCGSLLRDRSAAPAQARRAAPARGVDPTATDCRRDAAGTFPLLSRPHAPPPARTKTRAASRPAGSRRNQALITRPPAAPIGPLLAGRAPIGERRRARPRQGAVYFGLPARPAPGRSLRGAPPLPRLAGRAETEPRGKEGGGACGLQRLGTPPPTAHVQPPPRAELPPRSFVACRPSGTMHSPGSTGPDNARAVSDRIEHGARRGTREGWRLLAVVEAGAMRVGAGAARLGQVRVGRGRVSAAASLQLCLLSASAPPGEAISSHDVTQIQRRTAVGCGCGWRERGGRGKGGAKAGARRGGRGESGGGCGGGTKARA